MAFMEACSTFQQGKRVLGGAHFFLDWCLKPEALRVLVLDLRPERDAQWTPFPRLHSQEPSPHHMLWLWSVRADLID
jgi:hypothetical protein